MTFIVKFINTSFKPM